VDEVIGQWGLISQWAGSLISGGVTGQQGRSYWSAGEELLENESGVNGQWGG